MTRQLLVAMLAAGALGAQQPAAAPPTLIKNATILTVTKGRLENTDLLLQNGKHCKGISAPSFQWMDRCWLAT